MDSMLMGAGKAHYCMLLIVQVPSVLTMIDKNTRVPSKIPNALLIVIKIFRLCAFYRIIVLVSMCQATITLRLSVRCAIAIGQNS